MITLEIPETKTTLYLPSELSECDTRQYIEVCELIYYYNKQAIDYDTFRVQAVYKLLNLKPGKKELPDDQETFKNANIYQLSLLIDSFFEDENGKPVIKQNYVNNHIPFVNPLLTKYLGPTDMFRNITFGEYSDAMNLYLEYEKSKDEHYLQLIMAILYREASTLKPSKRIKYDEEAVDERAEKFKILRKGELYGFYLFFASFHKYLTNCILHLNGQEINIGLLFKEPTEEQVTSNLPGLGLKSLEYQISESGVFGTNKEVRNTNLWEILIRLYDITKRDADDKARHEDAERKAKTKNQ